MSSCQLFVPISVNTGKHRWRESNPRDAGLESGPQPLHTGDGPSFGQKKRAACCRYPAQTAPGGLPSQGSSRRTAHARAELVGLIGLVAHRSQTRRQSHAATPPGFVQNVRPVHDLSSGFSGLRELVSPSTYAGVNAFPASFVPACLSRRYDAQIPTQVPRALPKQLGRQAEPDLLQFDRTYTAIGHSCACRPRTRPAAADAHVLSSDREHRPPEVIQGTSTYRRTRRGGTDSESSPSSRYTLAAAPAALAQSAERLTRNEKVVGSIPTGGSTRSMR